MPTITISHKSADTLMRVFNCVGIGLLATLENTPTDAMFTSNTRLATNWAKRFVVESDELQHRICKPGRYTLSDDDARTLYRTWQVFVHFMDEDGGAPRNIRRAIKDMWDDIFQKQGFLDYCTKFDDDKTDLN
jgi:hypothetical protein